MVILAFLRRKHDQNAVPDIPIHNRFTERRDVFACGCIVPVRQLLQGEIPIG